MEKGFSPRPKNAVYIDTWLEASRSLGRHHARGGQLSKTSGVTQRSSDHAADRVVIQLFELSDGQFHGIGWRTRISHGHLRERRYVLFLDTEVSKRIRDADARAQLDH